MNRTTLALLLGAASLLALSVALPGSAQQKGAPQASSEPVIYLNQGWSQDDRDWYYHFSQGSAFLSYDIYLNLEAAGSQDLIRSGANSARFGLLPGPRVRTIRMNCRLASAKRRLQPRSKAGQPATMPA